MPKPKKERWSADILRDASGLWEQVCGTVIELRVKRGEVVRLRGPWANAADLVEIARRLCQSYLFSTGEAHGYQTVQGSLTLAPVTWTRLQIAMPNWFMTQTDLSKSGPRTAMGLDIVFDSTLAEGVVRVVTPTLGGVNQAVVELFE